MQIKLLKDIVTSVIGQAGGKIVDLLYDKKNVNEFLIAKKLALTINQTRNVLYKLADEGLVSFIRKKDSKKGGWYTYFWTLNSGKSLVKFKARLVANIEDLKTKINIRNAGRFFICPNCHIEYDESNALLHNYTCPECGEPLQLKDNSAEVESMNKDVVKLESVLAEVDKELGIIEVEEQKVKVRRMKAEQKKKDNERRARKKEKERLAKKEERAKARKKSARKAKKKGISSKKRR